MRHVDKTKTGRFAAVVASVGVAILMIGIAVRPAVYTQAMYQGLMVWATKVLPATLPYFILTRMLTNLGCVEGLGRLLSPLNRKLYRTSGIAGYIYLMSVISGYPVGARVTLDLARAGALDPKEATRVATFTSTSGPMFILGTVAGLFGSYRIGLVILVSHIVGALLNGLLYRGYGGVREEKVVHIEQQKSDAVYSAMLSMLTVGGYVAFFFLLVAFLNETGLIAPFNALSERICVGIGLPEGFGSACVAGLVEITKGCCELAQFAAAYPRAVAVAATAVVSLGGACIGCQGWTFLKEAGVDGRIYFLSKLTQGLISSLLAWGAAALILP